jgi:hypothetical protein
MSNDISTDRTYLVDIHVNGLGVKTYEVEAPNARMAKHFGENMAANDTGSPLVMLNVNGVSLKLAPTRRCVICGTPADGVYTSHNRCCADPDNIEED